MKAKVAHEIQSSTNYRFIAYAEDVAGNRAKASKLYVAGLELPQSKAQAVTVSDLFSAPEEPWLFEASQTSVPANDRSLTPLAPETPALDLMQHLQNYHYVV